MHGYINMIKILHLYILHAIYVYQSLSYKHINIMNNIKNGYVFYCYNVFIYSVWIWLYPIFVCILYEWYNRHTFVNVFAWISDYFIP